MKATTTSSRLRSLIVTAGLGIGSFALVALPAAANDFVDPETVTVHLGDLDISGWQGASVLYDRIHDAAADVCAPLGDMGFEAKLRTCVDRTVDDAVTTLKDPELNSVYSAKTGKTVVAAMNPRDGE
jgi:UrcA family protein